MFLPYDSKNTECHGASGIKTIVGTVASRIIELATQLQLVLLEINPTV